MMLAVSAAPSYSRSTTIRFPAVSAKKAKRQCRISCRGRGAAADCGEIPWQAWRGWRLVADWVYSPCILGINNTGFSWRKPWDAFYLRTYTYFLNAYREQRLHVPISAIRSDERALGLPTNPVFSQKRGFLFQRLSSWPRLGNVLPIIPRNGFMNDSQRIK